MGLEVIVERVVFSEDLRAITVGWVVFFTETEHDCSGSGVHVLNRMVFLLDPDVVAFVTMALLRRRRCGGITVAFGWRRYSYDEVTVVLTHIR